MKTGPHPLKSVAVISLWALLLNQLALMLWLESELRTLFVVFLAVPLLLPMHGLIKDRRYTYKWVGFLTLFYLAVGVSEAFSNPALRLYGVLNCLFSCLLFFSSIYYSRFLRSRIDD